MAREFVLSAVIELKDRMSAGVRRARGSMSELQGASASTADSLRRVENTGVSSMKGLTNATNTATGRVDRLRTRLSSLSDRAYNVTVNVKTQGAKALDNLKGSLGSMASGAVPQAIGMMGIGVGIADTINTYKNFEAQMSTVQAISGATGESLAKLTAKAKEMGATTQFSATEAGQAMQYMAMAGWDDKQMLDGIAGIMNLAGASGESLASVSDIVTDALTAFGLSAEKSTHFADVLAAATSKSNTNVAMMGETFKYVAPIAGAMKYSIEDTSLAIGLMANAGIKGSEAGTALRAIFTRMSDPMSSAGKTLGALGVKVANADGTFKPLRQTLLDLRGKFKGLTDVEKNQMATTIAGQEAMSGFLAMMNESDENFYKLANAVDTADGLAEKTNRIKNDNLAGDIELMKSSWEALQFTIMEGGKGTGGGPAAGLRGFVNALREDVDLLNKSLKKGLDIKSVGEIALNVVNQLYEKFKALDGIGSLLAGGALAVGLYKVISLSKRALGALKGLATNGAGEISNTGTGLPGIPNTIGQMTVNATSVVVNGRGVAGSVSGGAGLDIPGGEAGTAGNAGARPQGKWGRFKTAAKGVAGGIAKYALPLELASIGLDYYNTSKVNAEDSWGAGYQLSEAKKKVAESTDALLEAKSRNASTDEIDFLQRQHKDALDNMSQAQQFKDDTDKYNENRTNGVIGSGAGGIAGSIVGGLIGSLVGPVGTTIGAAVGGMAGSYAGDFVGHNFTEWTASASQAFEDFKANLNTGMNDLAAGIDNNLQYIGDGISNNFEYVANGVSNNFDYLKGRAGEMADGIATFVGNAETNVSAKFQTMADNAANDWENIKQGASDLAASLETAFDGAIAAIKGKFSELAASASEKLAGIKSSIGGAISAAGTRAYDWVVGKPKGAATGTSYFRAFATGTSHFDAVPSFATGTNAFRASALAQINEHGGELVQLPDGSKVFPTAETRQIINHEVKYGDLLKGKGLPASISIEGGTGSSAGAPTITITGNSFTIREEADIDKIAHAITEKFMLVQGNYAGC